MKVKSDQAAINQPGATLARTVLGRGRVPEPGERLTHGLIAASCLQKPWQKSDATIAARAPFAIGLDAVWRLYFPDSPSPIALRRTENRFVALHRTQLNGPSYSLSFLLSPAFPPKAAEMPWQPTAYSKQMDVLRPRRFLLPITIVTTALWEGRAGRGPQHRLPSTS